MAGFLDELKVYGDYLVIQMTVGAVEKVAGAQQGVIAAVGPLVSNFSQGPILEVGQEIIFRNGTVVKVDTDMQYVRMEDVLAVMRTPEEMPPAA